MLPKILFLIPHGSASVLRTQASRDFVTLGERAMHASLAPKGLKFERPLGPPS